MVAQPHPTKAVAADAGRRGSKPAAVIGGVGVALVLTAVWWAEPVVWLMPATGLLIVIAAVVDWHTHRIPNRLNLAALVVLGSTVSVLVAQDLVSGWGVLAGVALMAGPLLGTHLITRAHMPGLGDVKLAGVLGITLGAVSATAAYAALLGSLVLGACFGAIYRERTGARAFPLAPSIGVATFVVLVITAITRGGE